VPVRFFDINYETIEFGLPGSSQSLKCLPEKPMSDEVELKCVYVINTSEYVLEIVPQLQNQIEEKMDSEYQDKLDLANYAQDQF